jgi:hypothetical protein
MLFGVWVSGRRKVDSTKQVVEWCLEINRVVLKSRLEANACDPATSDNVGVAVLLRCNEYRPPEL